MTDKLANCPFCGGRGEVVETFIAMGRPDWYRAQCATYRCARMDACARREDAVANWNRRSISSPDIAVEATDELVEKVARAIAIYRANNPYGSLEDQACAAIASLSSSNVMVRDAVIEECAKAVEAHALEVRVAYDSGNWDWGDQNDGAKGYAAAIRAMLSASPDSPSPDIGGNGK